MLSKPSIYALRALLYISLNSRNNYILIKELSKNLDISFHFLTKILRKLKESHILNSSQGPKGGVSLAITADKIFLINIIKIFGDDKIFEECLLGLKGCGKKTPCPVHDEWTKINGRTRKLFNTTTIQKLSNKIKKSNLRISDLKIV